MDFRVAASLFTLVATATILAGCDRREEVDSRPAQMEGAATEESSMPAPVVNGVEVVVALTETAASQLRKVSGHIAVEVLFVGDPSAAGEAEVNELGVVALGSSRTELEGAGTAVFPESLINHSRLALIEGQPQVMINTTAAGPGVAPGMLACTYFWETLSEAGEHPVKIDCDLPSEETEE